MEEGLDYILSHFEGQRRLWPRTISTRTTEHRQVVVNSREEALVRFEQANCLDCRISAYPPPSEVSSFVGANLDMAPSVVMIDQDRETFKTQKAFEMALSKTLIKLRRSQLNFAPTTVSAEPTVIWSGRGYHIYLVLDAFVLEREDAFNNSKFGSNPSQKFLRFAEWFLSNGKCDPQHNKTVSFRNCMLRVPGSVNSKNGQTVRIIQQWNGCRPSIKLLLEDFYIYLSSQRLEELEKRKQKSKAQLVAKLDHNSIKQRPIGGIERDTIRWIENLLRTPITDYRKLAIWRIIAPYLLNIRGLSPDETQRIIHEWLDECAKLRTLDFVPSYKIRGALNSSRDFLPISCEKLKTENKGFYDLLQEKGVVS